MRKKETSRLLKLENFNTDSIVASKPMHSIMISSVHNLQVIEAAPIIAAAVVAAAAVSASGTAANWSYEIPFCIPKLIIVQLQ
jgi:hypothetical protein